MQQAVARVADAAERRLPSDYQLITGAANVVAGYFAVGDTVTYNVQLTGGHSYTVLAAGDKDVGDVDIRITDPSGVAVASEAGTDSIAFLEVRPATDGVHSVHVQLYRANLASFVAMALFEQKGNSVTPAKLTSTAESFYRLGASRNSSAPMGTIAWSSGSRQWNLWGMALEQGETMTMNRVWLPAGKHAIMANGDDSSTDIDLFLLSEADTVARDVAADAVPLIVYENAESAWYKLSVKNITGSGRSMILATVLNVTPRS
jgi:hypothetical protein